MSKFLNYEGLTQFLVKLKENIAQLAKLTNYVKPITGGGYLILTL